MSRSMKFLFAVLAYLSVLAPVQASAQAPQSARSTLRVPVLVALTSDPSFTHPFMILRRAGGTGGDVIVLREGAASGVQLTQAVHMLMAARRSGGDEAQKPAMMRGAIKQQNGQSVRDLPWTQRVVNDVRTAQPRAVPGVGNARAVQIWLPRQERS